MFGVQGLPADGLLLALRLACSCRRDVADQIVGDDRRGCDGANSGSAIRRNPRPTSATGHPMKHSTTSLGGAYRYDLEDPKS